MTSPPNNTIHPDTNDEFHAVAWVRAVRDQMYADTSTLSSAELIQFVREAATAANPTADKASADRRPA
jgi:hypothetical protein